MTGSVVLYLTSEEILAESKATPHPVLLFDFYVSLMSILWRWLVRSALGSENSFGTLKSERRGGALEEMHRRETEVL